MLSLTGPCSRSKPSRGRPYGLPIRIDSTEREICSASDVNMILGWSLSLTIKSVVLNGRMSSPILWTTGTKRGKRK